MRFSLRTLLLFSLLLASAGTLRHYWPIWIPMPAPQELQGRWTSAQFSPDNSRFILNISNHMGETHWLCDNETGAPITYFAPNFKSPNKAGLTSKFSPAGKWIVTGHHEPWGFVAECIFDSANGKQLLARKCDVYFAPADKYIFVSHYAGNNTYSVDVLDGRDGHVISTASRNTHAEMSISPDGTLFCWGQTLYDSATAKPLRDLGVPGEKFGRARISPDNRWIFVTGYKDGKTPDRDTAMKSLLSPQSSTLERTRAFETATGNLAAEFQPALADDPFALNNTRLLTTLGLQIQLRKLEPPFDIERTFDGRPFEEGALSPDGSMILTYVGENFRDTGGHSPRHSMFTGIFPTYIVKAFDLKSGSTLMTRANVSLGWPERSRIWFGRYVTGPCFWDSAGQSLLNQTNVIVSANGEFLALNQYGNESTQLGPPKEQSLISHHVEELGAIPHTVLAISNDAHRVITGGSEQGALWISRREPARWSVVTLPAFWLTISMSAAFVWSLARDRRELRRR